MLNGFSVLNFSESCSNKLWRTYRLALISVCEVFTGFLQQKNTETFNVLFARNKISITYYLNSKTKEIFVYNCKELHFTSSLIIFDEFYNIYIDK